MKNFQILSRRNVGDKEKVDFRPDHPSGDSPFAQLRRLSRVLAQETAHVEDFTGMDEALSAWREYLYRKVFSGTTHNDFVALNEENPQLIDWLIAVATIDADAFRSLKEKGKETTNANRRPT